MDSAKDSKSSKKSVSFPVEMLERADPKIANVYHGNLSAYLQTLVSRDLAGEMNADSPTALVDLARKFHPGIAEELSALCYESDGKTQRIPQAKLIGRLLEATVIALRAQKETESRLKTAPKGVMQAELARLRQIEDAFFQIAAAIIGYGESARAGDLMVAEPSSATIVDDEVAREERRRAGNDHPKPGAKPGTARKS